MCLIFVAVDYNPEYRLIIAANRDEFYSRPTAGADFWQDSDILAGQDLLQMGTWLGITRSGRFGALTNFRDPARFMKEARSRGELVSNYLQSNEKAAKYLKEVQSKKNQYNPFSLLVGDIYNLYYFGTMENEFLRLNKGLYGLSNHLLDTPWPKLISGKRALEKIIAKTDDIQTEELFGMLADRRIVPDSELPNTGIGLEKERFLSPIFIEGEDYGTRSSTVITVNRNNQVTFTERSFLEHNPLKWEQRKFEFTISHLIQLRR